MVVVLNKTWRNHVGSGDPFAIIASMDGEVFRQHKNRRTFRVTLNGDAYFVKVHEPAGWREVLKNVLRFRLPVLSALPERDAVLNCERRGIPTMKIAGFGRRGSLNPADVHSFLITYEIADAVELDAFLGEGECDRNQRRRLVGRVAQITRSLHEAGMNHRDLYLCHFLINRKSHQMHLIDLHRAQIRRSVPVRWLVKDLGGLLFSSIDAGVTDRECLRFAREYWGQSLNQILASRRRIRRIVRRAVKMYRAEHGRPPRLPAGLASFA